MWVVWSQCASGSLSEEDSDNGQLGCLLLERADLFIMRAVACGSSSLLQLENLFLICATRS